MFLRKYPFRLAIVFLVLLTGFLYSIAFLFYIQIFHSAFLSHLAQKQHEHSINIDPKRGTIYDRNLRPMAINLPVYSVYVNARSIGTHNNKDEVVVKLSETLHLPAVEISAKIDKNKYFVWIERKIPQEIYQKIKDFKLAGVGFIKESKRFYPNQSLAAHLIGFAGMDNNGLDGL